MATINSINNRAYVLQSTTTITAGTGLTVTTGDIGISSGGLTASGLISGGSFDTKVAAAQLKLSGTTLAVEGTDAAINLNINSKGTGTVIISALTLGADLAVTEGGTGAGTFTNHGVLVGAGTGAFTPLSVGTNGQVLLGSSAADPVFATLTSTGGTISYTPAAGTLNIEATAASETQVGCLEIATNVEVLAGTDTGRAVVVSGLTAKLGAQTIHGVALGQATTAALAYTSAGTAGQLLTSAGAAADPAWTTATVAGTYVKGDILFASAADVVTGLTASTAGKVLTAAGAGELPTWSDPIATAMVWTEVTGTTQQAAIDKGYVLNNVALVTVTLPATAAIGDVIRLSGKGAGGWLLAQNASQTVYFADAATTAGVGGSLASTAVRDSIELVCVTANADWNVISSVGNITVV